MAEKAHRQYPLSRRLHGLEVNLATTSHTHTGWSSACLSFSSSFNSATRRITLLCSLTAICEVRKPSFSNSFLAVAELFSKAHYGEFEKASLLPSSFKTTDTPGNTADPLQCRFVSMCCIISGNDPGIPKATINDLTDQLCPLLHFLWRTWIFHREQIQFSYVVQHICSICMKNVSNVSLVGRFSSIWAIVTISFVWSLFTSMFHSDVTCYVVVPFLFTRTVELTCASFVPVPNVSETQQAQTVCFPLPVMF